jgi:hypothetical protein
MGSTTSAQKPSFHKALITYLQSLFFWAEKGRTQRRDSTSAQTAFLKCSLFFVFAFELRTSLNYCAS